MISSRMSHHPNGLSNRPTLEQIHAVPCVTCGAQAGEKCELHSGQPRIEPHRDRRLTAKDLLSSEDQPGKRR